MKTKKVISLLCTICMAASLAACSGSSDSGTSESTNTGNKGTVVNPATGLVQEEKNDIDGKVIFTIDGNKYYCSPFLFRINDDDSFEPVKVYDEEKMSKTSPDDTQKKYYESTGKTFDPKDWLDSFYYFPENIVRCEKEFYGRDRDDIRFLYKWSFMDPLMVKKEELYTAERIQSMIQSDLKKYRVEDAEYATNNILRSLRFVSDGNDGYIYAVTSYQIYENYPSLSSRMIRYAKNGSKFEFIDGITADNLTINDGWIYYYDSGYNCDKSNNITFDTSRRGIYKINTEGGEKKKISEGFAFDVKDSKNDTNIQAVTMMTVRDNNLYFIFSDSEESYLYCMSTDGGTPQKFVEKKCYNYCFDEVNNRLYYAATDKTPVLSRYLVVRDLSDNTEKTITFTGNRKLPISEHYQLIQFDSDCIYMNDYGSFGSNTVYLDRDDGSAYELEPEYHMYSRKSGIRLDTKNNIIENIYIYNKWIIEETITSTIIKEQEPMVVVKKTETEIHNLFENLAKKHGIEIN